MTICMHAQWDEMWVGRSGSKKTFLCLLVSAQTETSFLLAVFLVLCFVFGGFCFFVFWGRIVLVFCLFVFLVEFAM